MIGVNYCLSVENDYFDLKENKKAGLLPPFDEREDFSYLLIITFLTAEPLSVFTSTK